MSVETSIQPELVQSAPVLAVVAQDLQAQSRIAVDTESNSLHAYREQVCLIQFSTLDRDYVVDTLALDDVSALAPIFEDAHIEKIFHAAEYDLLCLARDYGFRFANIFDTMQASRILGRKQVGLDGLLEQKFGVRQDKRFQKADWGRRPLSPELLQYAARDTHYLIALRDLLEADLTASGLLDLAREDFRLACAARETESGLPAGSAAWTRMSARRDLSPRELTVLQSLLEWREAVAERLNRPPFKVISDERLIEIARSQPRDIVSLRASGVGERQASQWASGLLEAVRTGLERPLAERRRSSYPGAVYLKRLEKLKEWRKSAASDMEVESDIVLPRGMLLALADRGPDHVDAVMHSSPWRLRRFGDQITRVLRGIQAG